MLISFLLLTVQIFLVSDQEFVATRIDEAPFIDGYLGDSAWNEAVVWKGGIPQQWPDYGEMMTDETEMRVVYDSENIYFGFFMYHSEPDLISTTLNSRDANPEADCIAIALDTFCDRCNSFCFVISAAGVQRDLLISDITGWDSSWDAVWSASTAVNDSGWVAEIKIPFSALRYPSIEEQEWGLTFQRWDTGRNEGGWVHGLGEDLNCRVADFWTLSGLVNLPSSRLLELRPYASGRVDHSGEEEDWDGNGDMGADIKIGLSSSITMDLAVNPDFGQVEADAERMNLSNFETYLREKRPFFIEGRDILDMPFNMLYSRRIGSVASNGELIPIIAGVKLSGNFGDGFRFGVLEAVTGRVRDGDNLIEPATNYGALRIIRQFHENDYIGISFTSVDTENHDEMEYDYARAAAIEGGVDFINNHRFWSSIARSWNKNIDKNKSMAYTACIFSFGSRLGYGIEAEYLEENFNVNESGYTTSTGQVETDTWINYRFDINSTIINRIRLNSWSEYSFIPEGETTEKGGGFGFSTNFTNNWHFNTGFWTGADYFDPYEGPEGYTYSSPLNIWINLGTDSQKPISAYLNHCFGNYRNGSNEEYSIWMGIKPSSNLFIELNTSWYRTYDGMRYDWDTDEFNGQSTDWQSLRVGTSYMFNELMSLKISSQYYRFEGIFEQADEEVSEGFWVNVLYSWEFRPGSTFYFLVGQTQTAGSELITPEPEFMLNSVFSHGKGSEVEFEKPDLAVFAKLTWLLSL